MNAARNQNGTSTCIMMKWDGQPSNHTFQPVQSRHLTVWAHYESVWWSKWQDLNSFPLRQLEETIGTSLYYVVQTILQDLKSISSP